MLHFLIDEFCNEFPHNLIPTPGYWIECSRQQITSDTIWDESESGEATDTELAEVQQESDTDEVPRKKTTIEEQWEKNQGFELTSVEQETYEKYFYGTEHWNYFTNDDDLGPVILSIKQETLNSRDQFRILVRAISYTVHGLIPASCVFADRYLFYSIFSIFFNYNFVGKVRYFLTRFFNRISLGKIFICIILSGWKFVDCKSNFEKSITRMERVEQVV